MDSRSSDTFDFGLEPWVLLGLECIVCLGLGFGIIFGKGAGLSCCLYETMKQAMSFRIVSVELDDFAYGGFERD